MSEPSQLSTSSPIAPPASERSKKGAKFWLIVASMCLCLFLSAFEFSSVSTALPTIASALHTSQFAWVGSAYALASTAFLPTSGGLAQAFGRRPAVLLAIGLFALGSAICGAATSMEMLIIGRIIQGLGGGGIQSLATIVLADLVTLQERGLYIGLYSLCGPLRNENRVCKLIFFTSTWCLAVSFGPVVGGKLAEQGWWRWLFCKCRYFLIISEKLTEYARHQSANFARCISIDRPRIGFTYSPW